MIPEPLDALMQDALPTVAPAISLAVYRAGKLHMHASWGWLDPDTRNLPVYADTLFDLASLTKLFTTTALLTLVSQRNISLQTPLAEFIPAFAEQSPRPIMPEQDPHTRCYKRIPPELAGKTVDPYDVTVWHLLTHTSGLAPWRDMYMTQPLPTAMPEKVEQNRWNQALEWLVQAPFVDNIGTTVRYSDIGLLLLGEVVARLHGDTLEDAIQQTVIAPLGTAYLTFNPTLRGQFATEQIAPTEYDAHWRKQRVWGIVHDENAASVGGVAGHAGLFGSAEAIAAFGRAWLSRDHFEISPDLWRQATSEQSRAGQERRGLGWMLRSADNSSAGDHMSMRAYGHTGFTGTSLWIDPDCELVIALLTNRVYFGREGSAIHMLRGRVHDQIVEVLC